MAEEEKTKIFLSAGGNAQENQYGELDEKHLSNKLKERLQDLGYEVYFAILESSTEGVVDGIFQDLLDSEYYLFVDYSREALLNDEGTQVGHRGSLFTNQELTVAKIRQMEIIPFQENGVIKEDGILRFIKVNATRFDRKDLVENVITRVKTEWKTGWKNKLVLTRDSAERGTTNYQLRDQRGDWPHSSTF